MVLPYSLLERFKSALGFYSCTVSNFEQYALATFIMDGYLERHINRMRIQYKAIRDQLIDQIKSSWLAPYIYISQENAGLHFLLDIGTDMTDEQLKEKMIVQAIAEKDQAIAEKNQTIAEKDRIIAELQAMIKN